MVQESSGSITPIFNGQTPPEVRNASAERMGEVAQLANRAYEVSQRAEAHYVKNRAEWVSQEHGKLVRTQALTPELRPEGRAGRNISAEADRNVGRRHSVRQARIELARRRMSRALERDDGRGR